MAGNMEDIEQHVKTEENIEQHTYSQQEVAEILAKVESNYSIRIQAVDLAIKHAGLGDSIDLILQVATKIENHIKR